MSDPADSTSSTQAAVIEIEICLAGHLASLYNRDPGLLGFVPGPGFDLDDIDDLIAVMEETFIDLALAAIERVEAADARAHEVDQLTNTDRN